jgi:hypothetical protein
MPVGCMWNADHAFAASQAPAALATGTSGNELTAEDLELLALAEAPLSQADMEAPSISPQPQASAVREEQPCQSAAGGHPSLEDEVLLRLAQEPMSEPQDIFLVAGTDKAVAGTELPGTDGPGSTGVSAEDEELLALAYEPCSQEWEAAIPGQADA